MGISSPLAERPSGDCTPAQAACIAAPDGRSLPPAGGAERNAGGAEVSGGEIDLVVAYVSGLAPPASPGPTSDETRRGRDVFAAAGCAACHRSEFRTLVAADAPHLSSKTVALYSDLLLHDMGDGLADHRPEANASGVEWRTTPLWGLGSRLGEIAGGRLPGLLHDGRAEAIAAAILWHGGEAAAASAAYAALDEADRAALRAFLAGL
jgi:CxxC motif-containing protein (DUF1111 family)